MAVPSSGALDFTDLQDEFGGSNPISISEYYRNGGLVPSNNTNVPVSGTVALSDFYGAVNQIGVTASAASSANLQSLFDAVTAGTWTSAVPKVYTVNSGTTMGILTAPASMGGTLTINIAGEVQGTGGAAASAGAAGNAGGSAITVLSTGITVNVTGALRGGGGGGGGGGAGGAGGQGKQAQYCQDYCLNSGNPVGGSCAAASGGYCTSHGQCGPDEDNNTEWRCYRYVFYNGGAGGAGGAAGAGIGYGQSASNGSSGSGGSSGSSGSGAGATGGTGGNGTGSFGAAGAAGANGGTGANGNSTNGAGGATGGAAGAAGRAITFSGVSAYTIIGTSSGTINGAYS